MNDRYRIEQGSQSSHCCFCWSIVDMDDPLEYSVVEFMTDDLKLVKAVCKLMNDLEDLKEKDDE